VIVIITTAVVLLTCAVGFVVGVALLLAKASEAIGRWL
jgi:hypothetical protein